MRRRMNAFTLIELLVVIAILTLIIAILLPSLGAARRTARVTLCATNVRQIATGWVLYAHDHHDVAIAGRPASLPGDNLYNVGNGRKFRPRWLVTLGASVQIYAFDEPSPLDIHQAIENPLLVCPEVREWTSERNTSYGYNHQFLGNARTAAGRFIKYPVKIDRILGATTVVLADCLGTAAEFASAARTGNRPNGSAELAAEGNHAYLLDPPRLTARSDRCDGGKRSAPDARHNGRAVFGFADGHAITQRVDRMGYRQSADGAFRIDDPESTNRFFSGSGRDDDPPAIGG